MTEMPEAIGVRDHPMNDVDVHGFGGLVWWSTLPDVAVAGPAASSLGTVGVVAARHLSGHPWLITSPGLSCRVLSFGSTRLAVVGETGFAADLCPTDDVGGWMRQLGSSSSLVVSEPGRLRVVVDAAGFNRVFTVVAGGVPVAASHAQVLRRLIDAPVNRVWVAAKLASPEMPSVLRETLSPFTGVTPVPSGHVAELDENSVRTVRWWHPPAARRSLDDGAELLRDALAQAVVTRAGQANGRVSVQLSGGLDSSALAALIAPFAPLLVTTAGTSPVDDDLAWASRAAAALPGSEHRVLHPGEMPLFFADLDQPSAVMDEPCSFTAGGARQRYAAGVLREWGTNMHFNGQGGDEVLLAPWSYLPELLRRQPRRAWRQLRGVAALRGQRLPAVLAAAAAPRQPYSVWLTQAAAGLTKEVTGPAAVLGWEVPPLLPVWASAEAVESTASALKTALTESITATPEHSDPGVHTAIVRVRVSAYRAALYRDAMVAAGVPTVMPFFDHTVLEACLATRPEERTDPWEPKPLLRRALREQTPAGLLARRTKGSYNADIYRGWHTHHHQVRDLLASSRLADLGLVNPDTLRGSLAGFPPNGLPPAFITDLVALEVWLRYQPEALTWRQQ
jgi:asparagine synthase (glutamine-hydrolysing)